MRTMFHQSSPHIRGDLKQLLSTTGDLALKRRAVLIITRLNPQPGEKILDAGCGDGFYLHLLSNLKTPLVLTGVDHDPLALESARQNLKRKKINLVQADLMGRLPFPDQYFDKIVLSEVLEHIPREKEVLLELSRILKTGGLLVLSVPNANYPFLWDPVNWILEHVFDLHIRSGFWAGIWNQHLRLYSAQRLSRLLSLVKFKVHSIDYPTFWSLPFNHYLLNFAARELHKERLKLGIVDSFNKFSLTKPPIEIKVIMFVLGVIDWWNNFSWGQSSVSLVVVAKK